MTISLLYTYLVHSMDYYLVIDPLVPSAYTTQLDPNLDTVALVKQNALVYLNTGSNSKFTVIDNSLVVNDQDAVKIAELTLMGEFQDLSHDQQKIYLAQGSEGFNVTQVFIPHLPLNKGKLLFDETDEQAIKTNVVAKSNFKILFLNDEKMV